MLISDLSSDVFSSDLRYRKPARAWKGRSRAFRPEKGSSPLFLSQFVADFGEQIDLGRASRRVGATAHDLVHPFDQQKDDESEDQEIDHRSEEHTSELQSLMRISYAVFCLKKKKQTRQKQ